MSSIFLSINVIASHFQSWKSFKSIIHKPNLINSTESIKLLSQPKSIFTANDKYVYKSGIINFSDCNLQLIEMLDSASPCRSFK